MRYSFHGKVRATGQQVAGYVEAESSTEAIDRLADQGIIGVHTVRAEPRQQRHPVLLAGTPEFDRAQFDADQPPAARQQRALPQQQPPMPMQAPQPQMLLPAAVAAPGTGSVSDAVLAQLVEKIGLLVVKMDQMLSRPAQVVYANGPAREGKGGGGAKRGSRNVSDAQNSTLKDIFQNNLDLRRSLQKLSDTVTPQVAPANGVSLVAAGPDVALDGAPADHNSPDPDTAPVAEASDDAVRPADDELVAEVVSASSAPEPVDEQAHGRAAHADDSGPDDDDAPDDLPMLVHDSERPRQAQPAA